MRQMRYIISALLIMLMLAVSACGDTEPEIQPNRQEEPVIGDSLQEPIEVRQEESVPVVSDEAQRSDEEKKILVAYFSWAENATQADVDAMTSASVSTPGNVALLASWIAEETGGDLFSIQVKEPYPADWDGCLARANEEKAGNIQPELVQDLDNMEEYDMVYLGYPNWWYSCPMAIHSFLNTHDFSGKQVYLFCSHGSGGLAGSVEDIAADIPNAVIFEHVFHVYEEDTASSKEALLTWIEQSEN